MSSVTEKVILDTDIGGDIDDALALAYLLCQERCELLGVTTVTGKPDERAEMVSAMCRHVGRDDVAIHPGCPEPMLAEQRSPYPGQARVLGNWSRRRDFDAENNTAIDFLSRTIRANPGQVTILAIGPMTNLATLMSVDPKALSLTKSVVLMAGRFFGQAVEWNVMCDPHAAAMVYGAGTHPAPPRHVSYGTDVTLRCILSAEEARAKFTAGVLEPVREFAEVWYEHKPHAIFHDPLAAACIFEPGLCTYAKGRVEVSLSSPTTAWTVFSPVEEGEDAPHTVAASVDVSRFFEHYFATLK